MNTLHLKNSHKLLTLSLLLSAGSVLAGLNDGMVGYYPLEGNALDASGRNHPGKVEGAIIAPDRFGRAGGAYTFDGVDDRIWITNHTDFEIPQGFTLAAWIRRTQPGRAMGDPILSKDSQIADDGRIHFLFRFESSLSPGADKLAFWWWNSDWYGGPIGPAVIDTAWHHVAAVQNGTNVSLFLDGNLIGSLDVPVPLLPQNEPIQIGQGHGTVPSETFFQGSIDEVRIYNRALSTNEIRELYLQTELSIQIASVAIAWNSLPGIAYQVEYRSTLTTNNWVALGAPTNGTGSRIVILDSVLDQPHKFYRVSTP